MAILIEDAGGVVDLGEELLRGVKEADYVTVIELQEHAGDFGSVVWVDPFDLSEKRFAEEAVPLLGGSTGELMGE